MSLDMNLERIGDMAVNIAEAIISMKRKPSFIRQTKFDEMSKVVKIMIKTSIDSFIDNNAHYYHSIYNSHAIKL